MSREVQPCDTTRAEAYQLWMKAPDPMVTFFKTLDVTDLLKAVRRKNMKFNMLMEYCVGKAASGVSEFYILPVGEKLIQYDSLAVSTIVKNKSGGLSYCDVLYTEDLYEFNREYMKHTSYAADHSENRDLSENSMVIGTSAIVETELDGVVGMNTGIFNNPFIIWGRYRRKLFRFYLPVSFQFHHTQMDGSHAGRFLENLQKEISDLSRF